MGPSIGDPMALLGPGIGDPVVFTEPGTGDSMAWLGAGSGDHTALVDPRHKIHSYSLLSSLIHQQYWKGEL